MWCDRGKIIECKITHVSLYKFIDISVPKMYRQVILSKYWYMYVTVIKELLHSCI